MGLVFPLDLNSPHSVNPCGKVLEVFWGVVEGYTSPRILVEVFGRSLSSGLLSSHQPDQDQSCPWGGGQGHLPTAESYSLKSEVKGTVINDFRLKSMDFQSYVTL